MTLPKNTKQFHFLKFAFFLLLILTCLPQPSFAKPNSAKLLKVKNTSSKATSAMRTVPYPRYVSIGVTSGASKNYLFPQSMQGLTDVHYLEHSNTNRLYRIKNDLKPSARTYNAYWSSFESENPGPDNTCPSGQFLVPTDEAERIAKGYNRFHCYHQSALDTFEKNFQNDAFELNGAKTSVVLWSIPNIYREADCAGTPGTNGTDYSGCVPTSNWSLDAYEDFVNFLAHRYNGLTYGKIDHFIVWNEVASARWFDASGSTFGACQNNSQVISPGCEFFWLQLLEQLMQRTHAAVKRSIDDYPIGPGVQNGALVLLSLDNVWLKPINTISGRSHLGSRTVLNSMWSKLGTRFDWSVAVHPYGDPTFPLSSDPNGVSAYSFNNLQMVRDYQITKLREIIGPTAPYASANGAELLYPQLALFASEQGQPLEDSGESGQGAFVCHAQKKATQIKELVATTHNYFQQNFDPALSPPGTLHFGIIPFSVNVDLSNASSSVGWQSYVATNPDNWLKNNTNYCCVNHGVGCESVAVNHHSATASIVAGPSDNNAENSSYPASNCFDGNNSTYCSSTNLNLNATYTTVAVQAQVSATGSPQGTPALIKRIEIYPYHSGGTPYFFPTTYKIFIDGNLVGNYTNQPNGVNPAEINFSTPILGTSVRIQMNKTDIVRPPGVSAYFLRFYEIRLYQNET